VSSSSDLPAATLGVLYVSEGRLCMRGPHGVTLTLGDTLAVLRQHEWHWKDDLKHVLCPTCGKAQRVDAFPPYHHQGCKYAELLSLVTNLVGDTVRE
jgi:hypothetical protein